jgi:hypothetical protein
MSVAAQGLSLSTNPNFEINYNYRNDIKRKFAVRRWEIKIKSASWLTFLALVFGTGFSVLGSPAPRT